MGGSSGGTQVIQPQTPQAPTAGQSAEEYAKALPSIYEAQLKYQPMFNQLELQQYQQLAPEYAAAYDQVNKQLYPYTSGLQEQLAKQAGEGMQAGVPDWMRQQYQSDLNAQLGTNVNAPIGGDYVSRGLLDQAQQYKNYYQNLALSVAGRQPLSQPFAQQSQFNVANQFQTAYGQDLQGYGAYTAANRPMLGQAGTPNWIPALSAVGNVAGAIGGAAMIKSSRNYKKNIVDNRIDSEKIIKSLKIVNYEYKWENDKKIGLIAEDTPDILTNREKTNVDLANLCGLLTDTLKKVLTRLDNLEKRLGYGQ